jgi:hypothetical protein
MDTIRQDLHYALRQLGRNPGFTLLAVLTLALGIGANTAIFGVVQGVLLRALPFGDAERLVMLYTGYPDDETRYPLSAPDFMSYHDDARSFSGVAAVNPRQETLTGLEDPSWVRVGLVSADFFEVMGVSPFVGRGFRPEENLPGRESVAMLTHAYWRSHFGADPAVVGRTLVLNGLPREVVGVLPPEFDFPHERQIYSPLTYGESFSSTTAQGRRSEFLTVVGRLQRGATPDGAVAEMQSPQCFNSQYQINGRYSIVPQVNSSIQKTHHKKAGKASKLFGTRLFQNTATKKKHNNTMRPSGRIGRFQNGQSNAPAGWLWSFVDIDGIGMTDTRYNLLPYSAYTTGRCPDGRLENVQENAFILEDNTIQPFVRIGPNVTLWSGNHIGHHSTVEDHVFIASHVVVSGVCR